MDIEFADVKSNLRKITADAGKTDADIIVFPELSLSGYSIAGRKRLSSLSQEKDSFLFDCIEALCISREISVVFGFSEKYKDKIYNSSMLIDEKGKRHVYRKTHLFFNEKKLFDSGDTGFFTVGTGHARVGMMICFDWFFPEAMRSLALKGADVILHPSNLVMPYCQDAMKTRCLENRVFAVTANRVGREGDCLFTGRSQITSPDGEIIAKGGIKNQIVLSADMDLSQARDKKISRLNDLFKDRRREYYVL